MNIGPRERRKRLAMGAAMLGVGVGTAAALILGGTYRWWRVGLVLPFWLAALGGFQAQANT